MTMHRLVCMHAAAAAPCGCRSLRLPLPAAAAPCGRRSLRCCSLPAPTVRASASRVTSVDDVGMLIMRDAKRKGQPPLSPPAAEWHGTGAQIRFQPIDGFLEGFGSFEATSTGRWCDKMHIWMKGGGSLSHLPRAFTSPFPLSSHLSLPCLPPRTTHYAAHPPPDAKPFGPQGSPELQLEHFVPLKHAAEALERTRLVASAWGSSLLYAEVRAVRGDEQALSPYTCDADEGYEPVCLAQCTAALHASRSAPLPPSLS